MEIKQKLMIIKKMKARMVKERTGVSALQDTLPGAERFRRWNLSQLQAIEAVLNRNGYSLRQFTSILEFGCGYGRLMRHVKELAPNAQVCGCDVQSDMVARCRQSFSDGTFIVNEPTPPLDFVDKAFDLIYSFSVFTHLSEPNHIAWLKELARMLKPGGVMLHTTHGYECLKRLAVFNPENLAKYEIPGALDGFTSESFCYHYVISNPQTPEYGYTIISREYILQNWEDYSGLTLVEYAEGAVEVNPEGCHDLVLLAKDAD